jgi:hypothetical protein
LPLAQWDPSSSRITSIRHPTSPRPHKPRGSTLHSSPSLPYEHRCCLRYLWYIRSSRSRFVTHPDIADEREDTVRQSFIRYQPEGEEFQRKKYFKHLAEPVWQDWTDYRGAVVPLEIIKGMREAEGVSEADWQGRGIVVGEKGWAVLTEWYQTTSKK